MTVRTSKSLKSRLAEAARPHAVYRACNRRARSVLRSNTATEDGLPPRPQARDWLVRPLPTLWVIEQTQ